MKKKNRKILIQTAIYITLVFLIGAIVCVYGLINQAMDVMLKCETSVMNDSLNTLNNQLSLNGIDTDYRNRWLKDPDYMQQELTGEEIDTILEFEDDFTSENYIDKYYGFSEEQKNLYAKQAYYVDSLCLENYIKEQNLISASLFKLDKDGTATYELFHSTEESINSKLHLGNTMKLDLKKRKGIRQIINNEYLKDKHSLFAGGLENTEYISEEIKLKKGDSIFVFTDGIPNDAMGTVPMASFFAFI